MERWEAEERARSDERQGRPRRPDWDQEGVGCYIRHPIERLELRLRLPASHAGVRVTLRCERHAGFPDFAITTWGDAELSPDARFESDPGMEAVEGRKPDFDDGIWRLTVERPVVGYRYRLCWTTPGSSPIGLAPGETLKWRQLLLSMADSSTAAQEKAQAAFGLLADQLRTLVNWGGWGEDWNVEFFVYDRTKLALRRVARRGSKPSPDGWQESSVGLGDGIAGAAFLRRSVVPWAEYHARAGLFRPVQDENPDGEWQTILGVPVYHPGNGLEGAPSLWGTIGVVCVSSSSPGSRIQDLLKDVFLPEDEEIVGSLSVLVQAVGEGLIAALGGTDPSKVDKN